ncbi:unnamed protein product [Peniophora sp. CBMAI 1063]|nr:unnamed protein product [Peniophora sp. CBMAI 1063]
MTGEHLEEHDPAKASGASSSLSMDPPLEQDEGREGSSTIIAGATTHTNLERAAVARKRDAGAPKRGFLGKLKKIEIKLLGTEEERAQRRAEMEKEEEEDRKRQEMAYQKQVERRQAFYAEREARARQGGTPLYPEGPEELNVFLNWP